MLRFILISVSVFLILNVISVSQLVRIHPRRKRIVIALVVICNAMWVFLPWLNRRTDFLRAVRATLGPPWFAWLCFVLVYSALLLLIFVAWLAFHRKPWTAFAKWPSRIFLWATIVAAIAGIYTALVPLDVERVPISLDDLPKQLDGTRIALIADLHVGLFTRPSRLWQVFSTINGLSPDIVVVAGDLVDDDPYFVSKLLDGTRALSPSTPLIGVLGNHEMYGSPLEIIAKLRGSRIRLLVNEGVALRRLWFAGLSDYAAMTDALKPNFDEALAQRPVDAFPIVIAHQPRAFPEAQRRGLPLTLAAHSHGGQFGFRRLQWSLAGLFIPYHIGLYRRGNSQLYVNTGTGYWLLPWRIGVTPEITLVELHSSSR